MPSRTGGTALIAVAGTKVPFDLAGHRVVFYDEDPAKRAIPRDQVVALLRNYSAVKSTNPVRAFLEDIAVAASPRRDPAAFERDLRGRIDRARSVDQLIAVWMWLRNLPDVPIEPLLTLSDRLAERDEWTFAAEVLRSRSTQTPDDFEIHRKLGWCLHFAGSEFDKESAGAFQEALRLNPNDPETLGMMGGRQNDLRTTRRRRLSMHRSQVFFPPKSLYMLVNEAALTILSHPANPDFGIELYRRLLNRVEISQSGNADEWTEMVVAESLFAIGDLDGAEAHYTAGRNVATTPKTVGSAVRQLELFAETGFRTIEATRLVRLLRRSNSRGVAALGVAMRTNNGYR